MSSLQSDNVVGIIFLVILFVLGYHSVNTYNSRKGDVENLPVNEKLVSVTWNGDSFIYVTRPMTDTDQAVTYQLRKAGHYQAFKEVIKIVETKH